MKLILLLTFLSTLSGGLSFAIPSQDEGLELFDFDAERDVRFFLYTRETIESPEELTFRDIDSVKFSHYDENKSLRVSAHGFLGDGNEGFNIRMAEAYLELGDFNVISVDYGAAQSINYIQVRNRVDPIGATIAKFLDFLHDNFELNFDNVTMVGISLGAHVAGATGKLVQTGKINTIFGLDPAGPLFSLSEPTRRLAKGDAKYVEAIHTNLGGFGLGGPVGDTDIFVNGGQSQPRCLVALCSHVRVWRLFHESILNNQFITTKCESVDEARNRRCTGERTVRMGDPSNFKNNVTGIFFVETNGAEPFGRG